MRTLLIEAAQVVARHDQGRLGQFYLRKRLQIGARKAVVALARKLVVAWRMLLTGEPYRDQVVAKTQSRQLAVYKLSQRWPSSGDVVLTVRTPHASSGYGCG